ncbi:aliphatic sulfonate ABC transporter substrate-binding protein [Paenibacillus endoradicis]|uniref:aliphatic sulfonate ABC transporter substrate-binding protein n=1 Tax=Paenibacillus endoradicis TaxID=2972487 RepID=UPI0021599069|nr:aliphatic sulfonate ABC transporter substrate-binding protein [Paenibacillus endoradicis]MCR8659916.1 aliphatic sulfonate ABC transporter substrate-binding protein [Paenibacillus endoradicis]
MMRKFNVIVSVLLVMMVALTACAGNNTEPKNATNGETGNKAKSYEGVTIKIGVQGSGGIFGKAREEKWFEQEFEKLGVKVEWTEFQSGPPMTEAIASNKLDIASLGNMPVVAGQAAGIPFTIISQMLEGTNNVAILVPSDSTATSLADLKGKKIAVTKGSNAYNFLYRGLKDANLSDSDVEVIQLQPDEAQPAFESGGVDAWATWDPYITLNSASGKAKVLEDGESLGVLSPSFTIARTAFVDDYPELITLYQKLINKTLAWELANEDEALERYAAERDIPVEIIAGTFDRARMINIAVSDEIIAEMQKTADFQYEIKNIRKEIKVADIVDNQFINAALQEPLE